MKNSSRNRDLSFRAQYGAPENGPGASPGASRAHAGASRDGPGLAEGGFLGGEKGVKTKKKVYFEGIPEQLAT